MSQHQNVAPNNMVCRRNSLNPGIGVTKSVVVSNTSDVASSAGTTVIDRDQSVYKVPDDWYDVLQEVSPCLLFAFPFLLSLSPSFRLSLLRFQGDL